jgi:hypothetical protein
MLALKAILRAGASVQRQGEVLGARGDLLSPLIFKPRLWLQSEPCTRKISKSETQIDFCTET